MLEFTNNEAAQRLGVSTDITRRRIVRGELRARKVPSPHGEIYLVEMSEEPDPVKVDEPKNLDRLLRSGYAPRIRKE